MLAYTQKQQTRVFCANRRYVISWENFRFVQIHIFESSFCPSRIFQQNVNNKTNNPHLRSSKQQNRTTRHVGSHLGGLATRMLPELICIVDLNSSISSLLPLHLAPAPLRWVEERGLFNDEASSSLVLLAAAEDGCLAAAEDDASSPSTREPLRHSRLVGWALSVSSLTLLPHPHSNAILQREAGGVLPPLVDIVLGVDNNVIDCSTFLLQLLRLRAARILRWRRESGRCLGFCSLSRTWRAAVVLPHVARLSACIGQPHHTVAHHVSDVAQMGLPLFGKRDRGRLLPARVLTCVAQSAPSWLAEVNSLIVEVSPD